jgi:hypothetical protein
MLSLNEFFDRHLNLLRNLENLQNLKWIATTFNILHDVNDTMSETSDNYETINSLLTLPNIQYLVQGLDVLLQTDLDGEKRTKVIRLRDELLSYINSIFTDYA